MAMDIATLLRETFTSESAELLARLRQDLVSAEEAAGAERAALLKQVWRDLHTLKGSSAAVGYREIAEISHALESLLSAAGASLPAEVLDTVHSALAWVESASATGSAPQAAAQLDAISGTRLRFLGEPPPAAAPPPPAPPRGRRAVEAAPAAVTDPDAPAAERPRPPPRATIRVDAARIEQVYSVIGDLIVTTLQHQSTTASTLQLNEEMDRLLMGWRRLQGGLRERRRSSGPSARLDRKLSAFTRDLTDIKRQLYRLSGNLQRQSSELSLLTDVLQDGLHRVRLLPVRPLLESCRPPLREAGRATGRRVRLVIEDSDAEVDRVVMEQLREPLLHLVRNAVAHGIEPAEERQQRGKPPVGEVRLSVTVEGEHTRFSVSDSGRGIDRQHVAKKAVAAGLLKPTHKPLDDTQLLDVLCSPGFSTNATIDQVSGRGVGMDVVRQVIQGLGGSIELVSTLGQGTTFSLRAPSRFTSSIGFIVACSDYRFGVLMRDVERILRVYPGVITTFRGANVLDIDGAPVVVVRLLELLGEPDPEPLTRATPALLLRSGGMRAVVLVDDIPAEIPMVVKPLGRQLAAHSQYAGCALEGDGSALPVLDVGVLLRQLLGSGVVSRCAAEPEQEAAPPTILLVEDSLTMRTLEQNILESAGFTVVAAADGQAAYELLAGGLTCSVVITDVNMPRMDGFSLCGRIRAEISSSLPVIIVTSQGSSEDKRQGVEVGADAFIIKGNFDQEHFLGTVRRLAM